MHPTIAFQQYNVVFKSRYIDKSWVGFIKVDMNTESISRPTSYTLKGETQSAANISAVGFAFFLYKSAMGCLEQLQVNVE